MSIIQHEGDSDNSILHFTSTCGIQSSLICCQSYAYFIADCLTSCILSPPKEQLQSILTATASWLIRQQRWIDVSIPCENNHPCIIFQYTFEEVLHQVGSHMLQWLNGEDDENLVSISESMDPANIILELKCIPQFAVCECKGCSECTSFVVGETNDFPEDSITDLILFWIQRNQAHFLVTDNNSGKSMEPKSLESIFPLLSQYIGRKIDTTRVSQDASTSTASNNKFSRHSSPSRHKYQTRQQNHLLSQDILLSSKSRTKPHYDDGRRFKHGDPFKISPCRISCPNLPLRPTDSIIADRVTLIEDLKEFHEIAKMSGLHSPRDAWEDWMDCGATDKLADKAFMCLIIILMSSSTTDSQLAAFIPQMFSSGLTSAEGVIEVSQRIGMDAFCALISPVGRFHQNAERIVHAASYFVVKHKGRIPSDISIGELTSLFGIGYKTAQIIVSSAFGRMDGIPSDVHVIRWCEALKWVPPLANDGLLCSKCIEQWLPKSKWHLINPLFGAFGQLIQNPDTRPPLLSLLEEKASDLLKSVFLKMLKAYGKN